ALDGRDPVAREHTAERRRELHRLARQRRLIDVPRDALARRLGRDHFEKLLLPRGAADRGDQIVLGCRLDTRGHSHGLITTSAPGGYPSLSAGTRKPPAAFGSAGDRT